MLGRSASRSAHGAQPPAHSATRSAARSAARLASRFTARFAARFAARSAEHPLRSRIALRSVGCEMPVSADSPRAERCSSARRCRVELILDSSLLELALFQPSSWRIVNYGVGNLPARAYKIDTLYSFRHTLRLAALPC